MPALCHMDFMAKPHPAGTEEIVHDSKSGQFVTVRGVGALKGRLTLMKGIDLTKPIASQVLNGAKEHQGGSAHAKR